MRLSQSCGRPLLRPEAARRPPPSSLPSMVGWLGGTLTFPRWREQLRCTFHKTPPGGIIRNFPPVSTCCQSLQCCGPGCPCPACHSDPAGQDPVGQYPAPSQGTQKIRKGSTNPRLMQELHMATDFTLWVTNVMARSLKQAMSILVVQERHLWLKLVKMRDTGTLHFLDAPISQAGLFGDTVEDFAQQFSAVQKQTKAFKHILPRRDPPYATILSRAGQQPARCRGCPPAFSTAAPSCT